MTTSKNIFRDRSLLMVISALLALPLSAVAGLGLTVVFIAQATLITLLYFFTKKHKFKDVLVDGGEVFLAICGIVVISLVASVMWSPSPEYSLRKLGEFFILMLLGFIAVSFACRNKANKNLGFVLEGGFYIGLIVFIIEITTGGILANLYRKMLGAPLMDAAGVSANLNRGACFLAIMFWPAFLSVYRENKKKAFLMWLASLILLSQMDSLAAGIGYGAASLVFLFSLITKGRLKIVYFFILAAIVLLPIAMKYIKPLEIKYPLPESAIHRIHIWHFAAGAVAQKPLLGWGFSASRFIPGGQNDVVINKNGEVRQNYKYLPNHPHNIAMQVLIETGIAGFALLIEILVVVMGRINRVKNITERSVIAALFVNYLAIDYFAFNIWQEWWVSAGFIALTLSLVQLGHPAPAPKRKTQK